MLIAKLIPERMEFAVVGSVNDVCELVQHGIDDLLDRKKLRSVARISETKEDLVASVHVQTWNSRHEHKYIPLKNFKG